ncbi:MAG: OadG family protein [Firmicutes bacterium]|nr:OadG family protein [Bacillota bacterium]
MELSIIDGLKIALYGFVTVFIALAALMLIINVLGKIVASMEESKNAKEAQAAPAPAAAPAPVEEEKLDLPVEYVGTLQLIDVDEKTAACIMAIISEQTQIPLENLIFKRIELIGEGE